MWNASSVILTPSSLHHEARLVVFLPGTGASPDSYSRLLNSAKLAGNYVIGLPYLSQPFPVSQSNTWCTSSFISNPGHCNNELHELMLFGEASSYFSGASQDIWNVQPCDSIVSLLNKTLHSVEWGKLFLKPNPGASSHGIDWEKKSSINEIICESKEIKAKRSLEQLLTKNENTVTKIDSEEKNLEKHHVEIIRIQDTMKHKLTPLVYTSNILKTDEEREEAARKLLCHLQQKRERKDENALNAKSQGVVDHQSMDMNFNAPRLVPEKSNPTSEELLASKVEGKQVEYIKDMM